MAPTTDRPLRVAPSLLAADFAKLAQEIAAVERGGADLLHLDIMDGHFVPNITFGPEVVEDIRPHSRLPFDAHLMVTDPGTYGPRFIEAGCQHVTFQAEVAKKPDELIDRLRGAGEHVTVGVSLNPDTALEVIEAYLHRVDMVLMMTVFPGFCGQAFMPEVLPKIEALARRLGPQQSLEVDGGIGRDTVASVVRAGADTLVAGSAIFGREDRAAAIAELREAAAGARSGTAR